MLDARIIPCVPVFAPTPLTSHHHRVHISAHPQATVYAIAEKAKPLSVLSQSAIEPVLCRPRTSSNLDIEMVVESGADELSISDTLLLVPPGPYKYHAQLH